MIVTSPEELTELVRAAVRDVLEERARVPEASEWLDASGAAELLGVNVRTITKRAASGGVPASRIGKLWRFRRADLLALLEAGAR